MPRWWVVASQQQLQQQQLLPQSVERGRAVTPKRGPVPPSPSKSSKTAAAPRSRLNRSPSGGRSNADSSSEEEDDDDDGEDADEEIDEKVGAESQVAELVEGTEKDAAPAVKKQQQHSKEEGVGVESVREQQPEMVGENNRSAVTEEDTKKNVPGNSLSAVVASSSPHLVSPLDSSAGMKKTIHDGNANGDDSQKDEDGIVGGGGWSQFEDASTGAMYWFNESTGESSWTQPVEEEKEEQKQRHFEDARVSLVEPTSLTPVAAS
mmetsp:Transcript_21821/g.36890  ORF Transcript_21821/g.36890 Transcript_21821/m.36890 type:complete len:264 (+) Transcript_21821:564-1355(+)